MVKFDGGLLSLVVTPLVENGELILVPKNKNRALRPLVVDCKLATSPRDFPKIARAGTSD